MTSLADTLGECIASMKADVATIRQTYDAFALRVADAESQVSGLKAEIAQKDAEIEAVKAHIEEMVELAHIVRGMAPTAG